MRKMALEVTIQRIEAPAPHEKVVVGVIAVWLAVISVLSFVKVDVEQWKMVIGIVVNINLCFFYGAPLSTIWTVCKTKDSSSIHKWTMLLNTANGKVAIFSLASGNCCLPSLMRTDMRHTISQQSPPACFWTAFGFGVLDW